MSNNFFKKLVDKYRHFYHITLTLVLSHKGRGSTTNKNTNGNIYKIILYIKNKMHKYKHRPRIFFIDRRDAISCVSLIFGVYRTLDAKYCVSTQNFNKFQYKDCFVVPLLAMTIVNNFRFTIYDLRSRYHPHISPIP